MSNNIVVELWRQNDNFVGVIIPYKSGVAYTNQCGGTACVHPEKEGIYIPLSSTKLLQDPFRDICYADVNKEIVKQFLSANYMDGGFEAISTTEKLHEA